MKVKELIELARTFPPEMDIAWFDIHDSDNGYSLSKALLMEVYEYPNGYREVRASVEEDYSE